MSGGIGAGVSGTVVAEVGSQKKCKSGEDITTICSNSGLADRTTSGF